MWIKKRLKKLALLSHYLSEKLQALSKALTMNNFNGASEQDPNIKNKPKKGLCNSWVCSVIGIFTSAYPEYVNKCVKVFFQWCSLCGQRQSVVPAKQHTVTQS